MIFLFEKAFCVTFRFQILIMDTYNNTDQKLHFLSQIIAKINRTFVEPEKDDTHTTLFFDPAGRRIYGRWIDTDDGQMIFAINLVNQSYEWLNCKLSPLASVKFTGKTLNEVEEEVTESLAILGINVEGLNEKMPYEMPDYPFKDDIIEAFSPEALNEWSYIRRQANEAAMMCLGMVQFYTNIRIWPEHFNTAISLKRDKDLEIEFGFAMQNEMVESPYFYISGAEKQNKINYLNLPDIGIASWEVNSNWKGAILPYTEMNKLADKYRKEQVEVFINNTILWYLNH
ncbi:MAG: hypothetical protein C0599_15775 [Salinivirgaceae bacterium]|nr:MAG: hypothetical protein C0599_15775 [Salinivirgaceae bacterium]